MTCLLCVPPPTSLMLSNPEEFDKWGRHVPCIGEGGIPCRVLVGKPAIRNHWEYLGMDEDNIKMSGKETECGA